VSDKPQQPSIELVFPYHPNYNGIGRIIMHLVETRRPYVVNCTVAASTGR